MKWWYACPCVLFALLAPAPGLQEPIAAKTILAIGDSITQGHGATATGGYRKFLDDRLDVTYQFIGKRRDSDLPDQGDWQFHNGFGGYEAAPNAQPDRSILRRFEDDAIIQKIGRPDVILLHVGTNSIGYSSPVRTGEDYASSHTDEADTQLYRLLTFLGEICPTTQIIVANILPKASNVSNLRDTFEYNFGSNANGKGGIPGVLSKISSSIADRVTLANMFQIDLHAIGRSDLVGNNRVDPDNDGIVDWVLNFDEYNYNSAGGMSGFNPFLLDDGVHPTTLGYQLMAAQWYQAMRTAGVVTNPTPSAAAAGLGLIVAASLRRRREA